MTTVKDRVAEAVRAFGEGEIVVVTDDDDRENEADLILAAVHATPEKIALVIRHTSGIVCAPLTREIARRLHLDPMVADQRFAAYAPPSPCRSISAMASPPASPPRSGRRRSARSPIPTPARPISSARAISSR